MKQIHYITCIDGYQFMYPYLRPSTKVIFYGIFYNPYDVSLRYPKIDTLTE